MDQQIGLLRCRYRLTGPRSATSPIRRLDRLAEEQLGQQVMDRLDRVFTGPEVYVVRRAVAPQVLDGGSPDDGPLVRAWASGLARAVSDAVLRDRSNGSNLVVFPSTVEFVAAFLADLIDGRAWEHWYYGPFRRHRMLPAAAAAGSVLVDHHDDLVGILAALERRGALEGLLDLVDPAALGLDRYEPAATTRPTDDPDHGRREAKAVVPSIDEWRPLVEAARLIVTRLWLTVDVPAVDLPSLDVALQRWLATTPVAPEWRDDAALSDAVAAVIVWLLDGLEPTADSGAEIVFPVSREEIVSAGAAVADWLDLDRLAIAVSAVGSHATGSTDRSMQFARSVGPTARRRSLVTAVRRAWFERRPPLDPSSPDSAANAARVLAALAVVEPTWADDEAAQRFIALLLAAWADVMAPTIRTHPDGTGHPPEDRPSGGGRPIDAVDRVDTRPGRQPAVPASALERVAAYGEQAIELVAAMAGSGDADRLTSDGWAESEVAGVVLMARALNDLGLEGLSRLHRYPPAGPGPLMTSVAWRLAGPGGFRDGRPDEALVALAGGERIGTDQLAAAWSEVPASDHGRWLETVSTMLDTTPPDDGSHFAHAALDLAAADAGLDAVAAGLVRSWARWLRGFETSSVGFVLREFVRRPGLVRIDAEEVRVRFPRRPLDTVLEIAGYLRPVDPLPGRSIRRIVFEMEGIR